MATISVIKPHERDLHVSRSTNVKVPYLVERQISVKELEKAKGSALANGDVIEALKVPANSAVVLVTAGVKDKLKASAFEVSVGTATSGQSYIAGADLATLTSDQIALGVVAPAPATIVNVTGESINITIDSITGANPEDTIRVNFQIVDLSTAANPGIAALGS